MVVGLFVVGVLWRSTFAVNFAISGAKFAPPFGGGMPINGPAIGLSAMFLYFGAIFAFVPAAADGLVVGIMQWTVIRRYVREACWWALINMLATGLAGAVVVVVSWGVGFAAGGIEAIQQSAIKTIVIGLIVWSAMGFTIGAVSAPLLNWLLRQPVDEGRLL
jgi:hypothetical protein